MLGRSLRFGFGGLFLSVALGFGCQTNPDGSLGVVEQAITGTCQFSQLGMPCDPDGAAGPLQECEGVCLLRPVTGPGGIGGYNATCVSVTSAGLANNDGKLCGSSDSSNCGQVCTGKFCVAKNAAAGTACRPAGGFTNTVCDGQCNGTGACVALTDTEKCKIERTPSLGGGDCVWDFCSATAAKTCVQFAIPKGVTCNDSSACTSGDTCDGTGKCTGTAKVCPPTGDPCLENRCQATTGACVAQPTTAACTLADKCFAGVCSGGSCTKGAAVDCDDKNPCTDDSCDAATGCKHTAKVCPPPSDACTVATCDAATGGCGFVAKSCDDGDSCTTDTCDKTTGCKHTPIPGCVPTDAGVDTGVDTGPIDTGIPPVDTGVPPVDTGIGLDTGAVDTGIGPDGAIEDSGSPADTGGGAIDGSPFDTGGAVDGATDGGVDLAPEDLSRGGCGCRTPSSTPTAAGAVAALGLAAGLVARRRRRR